ncbi:DJ-1/PfpI family protein [Nocardia sp. CDC159]|uniref:DJ-1/PfpI family protein n=1 Tax=Nocardia pulmonis TaxID=2951408 RepID=A0A9X2E2I2_9NOCA|nr:MULTISPECIES: DJ-1/PfpI family protein [Nocardia]MCM6771903.1 DJ-1/PfpI family protein [Nocardia pulmonis]MCM6785439.1 DJ-1/PfpI family protein [Nocardia sp. CDC159]
MTRYGLLIFDDVEELDFVGPWEVFTSSAAVRDGADSAVLIAERSDPVRCVRGMRVLPDHTLDDHPPLDVLLVPGGKGVKRELGNSATLEWIARTAAAAEWITSVCTGVQLLCEAGPARGHRVATHHMFEESVRARGDVTLVSDARYVIEGNLATSQGVSAGIDMALWLVGQLHGRDHAREVMRYMQYEPAPPYQADEPGVR